ncbi:MAG TPA: DUF72 domain-containing protein [Geminicoccaceae bacterium]|nr:DUF72 domain-containing protein [Geminicoccaceae bacterium]
MARGRWFIGTSGWSYRHWRGPFYPADMANGAEQLRFYVARFDTVEVNGTFYRLIEVETFRRWREATPAGFVFACKGSRYLTHMKRLKDPVPGVGRFFERVEALEDKLGPVVFQLPGRFKPDRERLERFIEALPRAHRYAFEFRDPAWFRPDILEVLAAHNVALCLYQFAGQEAPLEVTADFVYIRLHGPDGPYQGSYSDQALRTWAGRIRAWSKKGLDVYCYFDNDDRGFAPKNALSLKALLTSGDAAG